MPTVTSDERAADHDEDDSTTSSRARSEQQLRRGVRRVEPASGACRRASWLHPRRCRGRADSGARSTPGRGPATPDRTRRRSARTGSHRPIPPRPGARHVAVTTTRSSPHPAPRRPLERHPPLARDPRLARASSSSPSAWPSPSPPRRPTDADYRLGESGRADAMRRRRRPRRPGHRERPDHRAATARPRPGRGRGRGRRARRRRWRALDGVDEVAEPQWSPDRSALLVSVQLARGPGRRRRRCRTVTAAVQDEHPELEVRQAGDLTLDEAIDERVAEDLARRRGLSLPVTLVLMLLAFGALIAAGIPVLLAATSVAATIGITAPLSHLVHAEPTVTSMIVLIGMAVGVDYSLFYLKREREERAKRPLAPCDAVEIAAQTSGHSILVSGGAVIASMAGLYVIGDATFNSLATGAILVVAIAVLGSITVLPALLVKLGRWVDRPRVPAAVAAQPPDRPRRHQPARAGARSLRRPGRRAGALRRRGRGCSAVPALGMKMHSANLETLPDVIPEVQTVARPDAGVPGGGRRPPRSSSRRRRGRRGRRRCRAGRPRPSRRRRHRRASSTPASRRRSQVSADGRTSVLQPRHPVRRVRPAGRRRDRRAARRPRRRRRSTA